MVRTLEGLPKRDFPVNTVENLADLEYTDDIVLLCENVQEVQLALDKLTNILSSFDMRYVAGCCF